MALTLMSADVFPACVQFGLWIATFLLFPAFFQYARRVRWYALMRGIAWKIRRGCKSADVEKGKGGARKQLEWWIEAILKEESDSEAMAAERMEIIIAPLLRAICC